MTASPSETRQVVGGPDVADAEGSSEPHRCLAPTQEVNLHALCSGDQGGEQADRSRTEHEEPLARLHGGRGHRTERVAGRLDERAAGGVDGRRKRMEEPHRHSQLLGEGAGPAAPDADLESVPAEVRPAAHAAFTRPAAEHRVAGHAAAAPARVDAVAQRDDRARPLVSDADRVHGFAAVEAGHLAGEEFRVRAAHAGALDVDHHVAGSRSWRLDVRNLPAAGSGDDERSHVDHRTGQLRACARRSSRH